MNSFFSPTSTFATPTSQPPPINIQQQPTSSVGSNMVSNIDSNANQLQIQSHAMQGLQERNPYFYQPHQKWGSSYIQVPGEDVAGTSAFGGASWNQGQPVMGTGRFYGGYGTSANGMMQQMPSCRNRRDKTVFDNDTEMK